METGELPCSIVLQAAVTTGRRLAGDEVVGELAGSTTGVSQVRFGERGEEGLTGAVPHNDAVREEEGGD
jgi:hypothetical protein